MYNYTKIARTGKVSGDIEAQDELLVNGKTITEQIEGYRQISVSGRGLKPYEVSTVNYLRRSGESPTSHRFGTVSFEIKYLMEAEDSVELREMYRKLSSILLKGAIEVGFKDEEDYIYQEVYLTGSDNNEEVSNSIVRSFTLTAYDPYKYSKNVIENSIVETDMEFIEIESIIVNFNETVDKPTIIVNNGQYDFRFNLVGTVVAGTEFRLTVNRDTGRVRTTGAKVELNSLPRELILFNGARGRVSGSSSSKVLFRWRDKIL